MSIYREIIIDHYEAPRNFGKLKDADMTVHDSNPVCGDSFDFDLNIKKGRVEDVKFRGHGCAISTASASMLTEKIKGRPVSEIEKMSRQDILDLLGIELSHVRIKCAMLPLAIIKKGIGKNIANIKG